MELHIQKFSHMEVSQHLSLERVREGVVITKQCHGDSVCELLTGQEDTIDHDALVTQNRALKIGVYTADCAPIAYSDGTTTGVAHVGWKGLCLGLAQKMLVHFDPEKLEIFVGPHLHVFEIKKDECYEKLNKVFGTAFFVELEGKIYFHFKDALASLLPKQTIFDKRSTGEDLTLPSYRRTQTQERIITVVQFSHEKRL